MKLESRENIENIENSENIENIENNQSYENHETSEGNESSQSTENVSSNSSSICNEKSTYAYISIFIIGIEIGWSLISIIALIREPRNVIERICPGKFIWDYLLVVLILNKLITIYIVKCIYVLYHDKKCNVSRFASCIVIELLILALGLLLLNNQCIHNELRGTLIYASIATCILLISLIIILLVIFGYVIAFCIGIYKK